MAPMARRIKLPGRALPPLPPEAIVPPAPPLPPPVTPRPTWTDPLPVEFVGGPMSCILVMNEPHPPTRQVGHQPAGALIHMGNLIVLGSDQLAYPQSDHPHPEDPIIGRALNTTLPGQMVAIETWVP